jgi:hypothetical protein
MHTLIKNFADWQRVYEATDQVAPAGEGEPIALQPFTNEAFVRFIASTSGVAMQTLGRALLAKSACLTHKPTEVKDTLTLISTSWFIDVPAGSADTADSLGALANPVEIIASRMMASLKSKKLPVAKKIGDLSSAQQEFDKLVKSCGMEGLGDSDRALEHPFLPRDTQSQKSNYARLKNKEYDGLEGDSAGQGTLKVSLSVDASNSLKGILNSIVNAVLPTEADIPASYTQTEPSKQAFVVYVNKLRETLANVNVGSIFRIIQKNRSVKEITQDFSKPEPAYQVQKNQVKIAQAAPASPTIAQAQPTK